MPKGRIIALLLGAVLLLVGAVVGWRAWSNGRRPFEGELVMENRAVGASYSYQALVFVKGDKIRVEYVFDGKKDETDVAFLVHGTETITLFTSSRQYLSSKPAPPEEGGTSDPVFVYEPLDARATGKRDKTLAGPCDEWKTESSNQDGGGVTTIACVASSRRYSSLHRPWVVMTGQRWPGFPLRERSFDEKGVLLQTNEVVRVDARRLPDSMFEIPPGYRPYELKIPN